MTQQEIMKIMREQIRSYFNMEREIGARRKKLEEQLEELENQQAIKRAKGE